jgi:hypothetical protein
MAETKKGKRSEKSDAQLQKDHLEKVAHYIDQVDNWMSKLIKGISSKKHPLTDAQKSKATSAVNTLYVRLEDSLTSREVVEEKGFEF